MLTIENPPAVVTSEQIERAKGLTALVIRSPEDHLKAINGLTFVKSILNHAEKARKELVQPLNDDVKKVNISFKLLSEPFEQAERNLKSAIIVWSEAEAKRIEVERFRVLNENAERERLAAEAAEKTRKEAEGKARAEAEAAGLTLTETQDWLEESVADVPVIAAVQERMLDELLTTTRASIGSVTIRKVWKFEIICDVEVPRAFCKIDESLIRLAVNSGVRNIAGVRIFEMSIAASGRNR